MIRKRQLLVNSLMSVVQVVVTGISFFVLYRFVKDAIGIDNFGIWSVVLATTSAGSIANLGLATSAVKFVSMYLARDRSDRVVQVVQTAAISLAVFLLLVLLVLYPVLASLLGVLIEPAEKLPEALAILPYALVSFWLGSVGGVFQASIDGYQRIDLRSILLTVSTLVYLVLAFVLVPQRGLVGLAQAQVLQAGLLFLLSWIVLKRLLPALPVLPYRWHGGTFREMFGYGVRFQAISFSSMFFEPVTKGLIVEFGGLTASGYFEFAYRMVVQLRALIATAHQSIVPTIADLQERRPDLIQDIYRTSYRLLLYLIIPSLPFFIALTPLISRVWIGSYEPTFVLFADLIFAGWFLNMLSNPAYFAYLGIGKLRWNVAGHVLIGVLNGVLGLLLGWHHGGAGVVVGFVVALVAGSLVIAVAYQREYDIRFADLLQRESVVLGIASLAGLGLTLLLYDQVKASWSLWSLVALVLCTYLAVVVVPLWIHPARRQLQAWLKGLLVRTRTAPQSSEG